MPMKMTSSIPTMLRAVAPAASVGIQRRRHGATAAVIAAISTTSVTTAPTRPSAEEGELLRALTIDPTRDYQPLNGRWPVHNVLRQASGIS